MLEQAGGGGGRQSHRDGVGAVGASAAPRLERAGL